MMFMQDELRKRRIKRGWTQAHVAELVGTVQSHVSELERGIVQPTLPVAQAWAHALGFRLVLMDQEEA